VDRKGPQAPGSAQNSHSPDSRRAVKTADQAYQAGEAGERVRAFITRHGLANLVGSRAERPHGLPPCDAFAVTMVAECALSGDGEKLRRIISDYSTAGWSNSVLLLDLLFPAVRLIGTWWEEDRCDFATTTLSTGLIERVVYEVTLANRRPVPLHAPRALIAVTPDDQHSFGAVVLSEILRSAGWFVLTRLDSTADELRADVAQGNFALIGLSLSRTSRIDNLRGTISILRSEDNAGQIRFAVGGRVFTSGEAHAGDVGADFMAVDPPEMIRLLDDISTFVAAD